jgi:hypothetical protein
MRLAVAALLAMLIVPAHAGAPGPLLSPLYGRLRAARLRRHGVPSTAQVPVPGLASACAACATHPQGTSLCRLPPPRGLTR